MTVTSDSEWDSDFVVNFIVRSKRWICGRRCIRVDADVVLTAISNEDEAIDVTADTVRFRKRLEIFT